MKGLILKDFYCLRTSIKTLVCISLFSFVISVMCIMSMQYGNLAILANGMVEDSMDADFAGVVWRMLLALFIFLPMSLLGNVTQCFSADKKAGFTKIEASLPVSAFELVTARFVTILLFGGTMFGISNALAFVSGILSPDFAVGELIRFNTTLAGIILATVTITSFFMYLINSKYVDIILAIPVFAVIFAMNLTILKNDGEIGSSILLGWIAQVESNACLVGGMSMFVTVCAYLGSILVVRKKRGIR